MNKSISGYYNKNAIDYYNLRVKTGGSLFNEYIEMPAVLSLLENEIVNSDVLDIGCGLGLYSKILSEKGAKVTAIDGSIEMIKYAKCVCDGLNVNFVNKNFEDFQNTKTLSYDIIIGGFMLSYFNDLNIIFLKISKLLSENGKCILSMLHPLRLSSKRNPEGQYFINNYFDNSSLYETDFLNNNELLYLKKWSISDISKASKNSGLLIESILEPIPICLPSNFDSEKVKYFYNCPSVIIFKFVKK